MTTKKFSCDLCGSSESIEVPHCREYTNNQPIQICTNCGFVYVKSRRSHDEIAKDWSENIFGSGYTANIPAVKARLMYVAESLDTTVGLKNKMICDIGAGEGLFLKLLKENYSCKVFGIEPSLENCKKLKKLGIDHFNGTIEDYKLSKNKNNISFDVVTIMWTLENTQDCIRMLKAAHSILKKDGHILVATGSRILVPFKKPLYDYLSTTPADTHSFRFSVNSLSGSLLISGFNQFHINHYIDTDYLCIIAEKNDICMKSPSWIHDNYLDVYNFFERWHVETQMYYSVSRLCI